MLDVKLLVHDVTSRLSKVKTTIYTEYNMVSSYDLRDLFSIVLSLFVPAIIYAIWRTPLGVFMSTEYYTLEL